MKHCHNLKFEIEQFLLKNRIVANSIRSLLIDAVYGLIGAVMIDHQNPAVIKSVEIRACDGLFRAAADHCFGR